MHTFTPLAGYLTLYETNVKTYSGSATSGTLLETRTTTYTYSVYTNLPNALTPVYNVYPNIETTSYPSGLTSQVITTYDAPTGSGSVPASNGSLLSKQEFSFGSGGPGSAYRTTTYAYLWQKTSAYLNANALRQETAVTITDASGSQVASTSFAYDENNGSPTGVHGNQTSKTSWVNGGTSPTVTHVFNSNGSVKQTTDARAAVTKWTYDQLGLFPIQIDYPPTPHAQTVYTGYDDNTGVLNWETDENGLKAQEAAHTTNYSYDVLNRLSSVSRPDGGSETFCYTDLGGTGCSASSPPFTILRTVTATPSPIQVSSVTYDGVGHPITSVSAAGAIVTSNYDALGRLSSTSNPYFSGSSSNNTTFTYDALDRKRSQTQPDGSSSLSWTYADNAVTFTDEAGNQRQQFSDAFGRLSKVLEPDGLHKNPSLETDYSYDLLNNLTCVEQHGGVTGTGCSSSPSSDATSAWHIRRFTYDSLSRLLTANNPENGLVCYGTWSGGVVGSGNCQNGYDANGNLLAKTDARNFTVSYQYDALNRLSQQLNPYGSSAYFTYDQPMAGNFASSNQVGRLVESSNHLNSDRRYAYDAMGRVIRQANWTLSAPSENTTVVQAAYDLAGELTSLTYPDGRTIKQTWDGAGHPSNITFDNWNGTNVGYKYLNGASYFPNGSPQQLTLGNGIRESYALNNRLQPTETLIQLGSSAPFLDKLYCYGPVGAGSIWKPSTHCLNLNINNNGNIQQIPDVLNNNRSQGFSYDTLNRITGFVTTDASRSQSYQIDPFGNMQEANSVGLTNFNPGLDPANNNRILGIPYDAAGNVQGNGIPVSSGGHTFAYDGESRIVNVDNGAALYTYDADGDRLRKDVGTDWTEYIHFNGLPLAEKHADGTWSDYIYANGQRIVKADSFDNSIKIQGTNCSNCGWQYAGFVQNWITNYTVQSGDKLYFRQYQSATACGGADFAFTDGTRTAFIATDTTGQAINTDTIHNQWLFRTVDLTQFAGKTIWQGNLLAEGCTGAGPWQIQFADMALQTADGRTLNYYDGQSSVSLTPWYSSGMSQVSYGVNVSATQWDAEAPQRTTHYYHGDQIGSARMITGGGGWPLSTDDFSPFGQELTVSFDPNHYKFTGKERDAESGLDYFGARYYASNMGRFMSPDPAGVRAVKLANPQTWNWYAYVQNNPLRYTDPTGMYTCADDHNKCATDKDKAFEASRQNDLSSKDKGVAAAAKAYGDPTKDNHVGVQFTDAKNGNTSISVSTDGKTVTSQITVSIPNSSTGTTLDGIVGHEGTHVEQGEALLGSFKPNGSFNGTLNLSVYNSELPAYQNQASIWQQSGQPYSMNGNGQFVINPGDGQGQVNNTINQFLKDPANGYGVTPQNPGAPMLNFTKDKQ